MSQRFDVCPLEMFITNVTTGPIGELFNMYTLVYQERWTTLAHST